MNASQQVYANLYAKKSCLTYFDVLHLATYEKPQRIFVEPHLPARSNKKTPCQCFYILSCDEQLKVDIMLDTHHEKVWN